MNESDNSRAAGTPAFKHGGTGMSIRFSCGACAKPRPCLGRKLMRVRGLRTWVCSDCAKVKEQI